jgi:hypothetical protein
MNKINYIEKEINEPISYLELIEKINELINIVNDLSKKPKDDNE